MEAAEPTPRKNADLPVRLASAAAMLGVLAAALVLGGIWFDLFVALVALVTYWEFARLVMRATAASAGRLVALVLGAVYIGAAAYLLSGLHSYFLLAAIGSVVATDTGAYFVGRAIGGPRIAPSISPSKTWAGLVGGMLFAGLFLCGMVLTYHYIGGFTDIGDLFEIASTDLVGAMLVGGVLAIAAQAGDFFESWLKRRAGVKDSSNLLPGHGGVFDRTDGLLPVAIIVGAIASMAM